MELANIRIGTILVSNSLWGPTFVQVADIETNRWGTHLVCVRLIENAGETVAVHSVGSEDMRGTGWKLATESDISRMRRWMAAA